MRHGALRSPAFGGLTPAGNWLRVRGRALLLAGVALLIWRVGAYAQTPSPTESSPGGSPSANAAPSLRGRIPAAPLADDGLGQHDLLLEADSVVRDQTQSIVTATGHVQVRYQGRTLRADKLIYNTVNGTARATGHAVLINPDGSVLYGEDVLLDDQFRAAVAYGFATREAANTTLAAGAAVRRNEMVNQLNNAVYTACNICAMDGRPIQPTWSITASRIVEDRQHHVIYYRNAVIRVLGVPIFYAPVFWHPDPTTPRRSGLLTPRIEYSRRRGLSYEQPYLLTINPSTDLILSPQINTRVNPFLNLRYTERFYSGEIDIRAGYTYSEQFNNHYFFDNDTSRSYILARGLFDVTPDKNWVWGFGAERATDPTLFARYGIHDVYTDRGPFPADTDRLITQLYSVREESNSYISIAALDFQSLRVNGVIQNPLDPTNASDTIPSYESSRAFPVVAPLIEARYDAPNELLGGQLELDANAVALTRNNNRVISVYDPTGDIVQGPQLLNYGNGNPVSLAENLPASQIKQISALEYSDSRRVSAGFNWRTSFTLDDGIRIEPFVYGRADGYSIDNPTLLTGFSGSTTVSGPANVIVGANGDGFIETPGKDSVGRISGTAGANFSWPFIKPIGSASIVLEPLAQIAISPVYRVDPNIPNEDSAAFEYDETNLFSIDRFAGFDLIEGGQRLNVGARGTVNWGSSQNASLLVGRTFRAQDDPQFTALSGLQGTASDWIVAATAQPISGLSLFTRSRLDRDTLALNREEAGIGYASPVFTAQVRYDLNESGLAQIVPGEVIDPTLGEAVVGQTIITKTEDVSVGGDLFFTRHWGVSANVSRDLQHNQFPIAQLGLIYDNECIRVDVLYTRDETFSSVIGTSNSITFRISLTTLGGNTPLAPSNSQGIR